MAHIVEGWEGQRKVLGSPALALVLLKSGSSLALDALAG